MSAISYKARQAVYTRLTNVSTGFNVNLAAVVGGYGVTAYTVDFTSTSRNFQFAKAPYALLEQAQYIGKPANMLLYTNSVTESTGDRAGFKFETFGGAVSLGIDLYLTSSSEKIQYDMESLLDATEEAMVATLNAPSVQTQMNGNGLTYNGDIAWQRPPIAFDGRNIVQCIRWTLGFRVSNI